MTTNLNQIPVYFSDTERVFHDFAASGTSESSGELALTVSGRFAATGKSSSSGEVTFHKSHKWAAAGTTESSGFVAFTVVSFDFRSTGRSTSSGSIALKRVHRFGAAGTSESSGSIEPKHLHRFIATGTATSRGALRLRALRRFRSAGTSWSGGFLNLWVPPPPPPPGLRHVFQVPGGSDARSLPEPDVIPARRQRVGSFVGTGEAPGGFGPGSGIISEDEYLAHEDVYKWGTIWRVYDDRDDGRLVWAGRLTDPQVIGGVCKLSASGLSEMADEVIDSYLWQTRDEDRWTAADAEPHNYTNHVDDQITAKVHGRRLVFRVRRKEVFKRANGKTTLASAASKGNSSISLVSNFGGLSAGERIHIDGETRVVAGAYSPGSTSIPLTQPLKHDHAAGKKVWWSANNGPANWKTGMVFWAPTVKLKRFRATIDKQRNSLSYTLELLRGTGPNGALTLVDSWSLGAGGPTVIDVTFAGNPDLLMLRLKRDTETEKARGFRVAIKDIRVNGPFTTGDNYPTSSVMADLAQAAGIATTEIAVTTTNALPLDVDSASVGQVADELALLDDHFWGIEDDGSEHYWAYREWGNRTWFLNEPRFPKNPIPLKRFNKVRVPHRHPGGVRDWVTVAADPDPLPSGQSVTMQVDLDDPLPPKYISEAFGRNIADYVSLKRVAGSAIFSYVHDGFGLRTAGTRVRAGDVIVIPDLDGLALRVSKVSYEDDVVQVEFPDQHPLLERVKARRNLVLARGRSNADATLGGFDLEEPAVPENVTMTFREAEKRGGRRRFHAVLDWDAVTEDIEGNGTAIKRYVVQMRPVDASGELIPDNEGGGIRRIVIDRQKLDDPSIDDLPTRAMLRNLEHPKSWRWQGRVLALDIQGERGKFSAWTTPQLPTVGTPPAPSSVTIDVDQHKLSAEWEAWDPTETDEDGAPVIDQRIARFKVRRMKSTNGGSSWFQVGNVIRVAGTSKTWKLSKPGNALFRVEVKSLDHYGGASAWVSSGTGQKGVPPTPGSAPTLTFDLGGKRGIRGVVDFTYTGAFLDDDTTKFVVQLQVGEGTSNPGAGSKIRRTTILVDPEEAGDPQQAIFGNIRAGRRVRARYKAVDAQDRSSAFSAWTSIMTATVGKKPGKVRNRQVIGKTRAIVVKFDAPNQWADGTIEDWDVGEVARYEVDLRRAGAVVETVETLSNKVVFPMTKAEAALTGYRAVVRAIGHDETVETPDAETGNATPEAITVSGSEIDTGSIVYDHLAGTLGGQTAGFYGSTFESGSPPRTRLSGGPSGKNGDTALNLSESPPRLYKYESGVWWRATDGTDITAGSLIADKITSGTLQSILISGVTIVGSDFRGGTFRSSNGTSYIEMSATNNGMIQFVTLGSPVAYIERVSNGVKMYNSWASIEVNSTSPILLSGGTVNAGPLDVSGGNDLSARHGRFVGGGVVNFVELGGGTGDPSAPSGGGRVYVESGNLKVRFSNGVVRTLATN